MAGMKWFLHVLGYRINYDVEKWTFGCWLKDEHWQSAESDLIMH